MLKKISIFLSMLLVLFTLHITVKQPKINADWDPEFKTQATVLFDNNTYKFKNLRDWKYSETEVLQQDYLDVEINPSKIINAWILVEPFGSWDGVAHTYFTFNFSDNEPISFSIEAKREANETYSATKGMFREFEIVYVWGTENDLLNRRVKYLKNDVYMYPLQISQEWRENLFKKLVQKTHELEENPRFYNTLDSNCTNLLADIVNEIRPNTVPWHYARIFTGFTDEYLYELGFIPNNRSFEEIRSQYKVN